MNDAPQAGDSPAWQRAVLALALVTVVGARGIAAALPGRAAGIDRLISLTQDVAAHLSQGSATLFVALALRQALLLFVIQPGRSPVRVLGLKLLLVTATLITSIVTLFSALLASDRLDPVVHAALATSVLLSLALVGAAVLPRTSERAIGLIVLGAALAGTLGTGARLVALLSTEVPKLHLFYWARCLATLSFATTCGVVVMAYAWLLRPTSPWPRALAALFVAAALGVATMADGTIGWRSVIAGTLEELGSEPAPLIWASGQRAVELLILGGAAVCVSVTSRPTSLLLVLGLVLMGANGADVPMGAVFVINAALLLALGALSEPGRRVDSVPTAVAPRVTSVVTLAAACLCAVFMFGCNRPERAPQERGASIFVRNCSSCHGPDARGLHLPGFDVAPRNLTERAFQESHSDAELAQVIKLGRGRMPAFAVLLTDDDVRDVVGFLRTLPEK